MTEKMVRCPRCHDVFDAAEWICPRCGTTYEPVAPLPDRGEGFFVEKYSGTPSSRSPIRVPSRCREPDRACSLEPGSRL